MTTCESCRYYRRPNFCGLGYVSHVHKQDCGHIDTTPPPTIELVVLSRIELRVIEQASTICQAPKKLHKMLANIELTVKGYQQKIKRHGKRYRTRTVTVLVEGNPRGGQQSIISKLYESKATKANFSHLLNTFWEITLVFSMEKTKYYQTHKF